jgi:putative phosphoserine phosphatase/1-acylglycerol-3-phosphate O-acyltransferase
MGGLPVNFEEATAAVARAPEGPRTGAFFDFDGTLINGYSASALLAHRFRAREIGPLELLHTARALAGDTLAEAEFSSLVTRGFASWAGRSTTELEELGTSLFRQHIAGDVFHEVWRLVKAHQRRGHTVAIATSATRFQVAPLARELGVEHVLCTELEVNAGVLTGRVDGRTLWGPGKSAAVRAFATEYDVDLSSSYAYANGDEDVPFLRSVGHPCAVNPQPALAQAAAEEGWPVLRTRPRAKRFDLLPAARTVATYGTLVGAGAAGVALGVATGNKRRGVDLATSVFAQVASALSSVEIDVVGEANLWQHRPAVFMINHQSSLIDLVVTANLLRGGVTAVAKKEAASIPVIGKLLELADFAFIDRADSGKAQEAMREALDRLAAGTSIVIAPEGTRSYTPRVGEFKKGGFHLAMQAGVPIVPIVIRNAGELMWRNARTMLAGAVQVVVHEPIPTAGWTKKDLDDAVERAHALYVDTMENWPSAGEVTS